MLNRELNEIEKRIQVNCNAVSIMEFYQAENQNLGLNHNFTKDFCVGNFKKKSLAN